MPDGSRSQGVCGAILRRENQHRSFKWFTSQKSLPPKLAPPEKISRALRRSAVEKLPAEQWTSSSVDRFSTDKDVHCTGIIFPAARLNPGLTGVQTIPSNRSIIFKSSKNQDWLFAKLAGKSSHYCCHYRLRLSAPFGFLGLVATFGGRCFFLFFFYQFFDFLGQGKSIGRQLRIDDNF